MSTIRFGQACDACLTRYPDYNAGSDIGECDFCLTDYCAPCAERTGHSSRESDGRIILDCEPSALIYTALIDRAQAMLLFAGWQLDQERAAWIAASQKGTV